MRMISIVLAFMLVLSGCGKMTELQKSQLVTAALVAKERAAAFAISKAQIQPKVEKHRQFLAVTMERHSNGLNADAIALADLVTAVQKVSTVDKRTRQTLFEMAKTSTARAANFKISLSQDIAADGELLNFLQVHLNVLESTATSLALLADELKPKEPPK